MDIALELDHLAKTYRVGWRKTERTAVVDISLAIPSGTVFGLLGPNGAGKTTTIKMAVGLLRPDSGSVRILGQDMRDTRVRGRIGFLPENPYFYSHLTAERALDFYAKLFRLGSDVRNAKKRELLELVGLGDAMSLPLGKYSKGMLQRFGIAQALINDPELLIVDEPTSGLDPIGQVEIRKLLVRLNEEGKSILLSSHYLSEVENICHEAAIVNKGTVVTRGKIAELVQSGNRFVVQATGLPRSWRPVELPVKPERSDGFIKFVVEKEHLDEMIANVHASDGHIEDVRRVPKTLEDLFLELVGGENDGD